ncbi:hypothetical protein BVF91_09660 [Thermoanaerobacterium sp. PSU-2]|uniref:hypothetical protein n=1 Tax=Thermoanaerobacterium sp. PSU-2 TaxID=1930849 RepID=UPI000A14C78D|nr:hypothetical protein [Thermoanaerobacterium sp. PSU-2]ORX22735.1 hypothetical protein BVF91_09660 [Thermoanaerobacterium sp. PSU-2]
MEDFISYGFTNRDIMAYLYRAIVRYLNGDVELFKHYTDKALKIYMEDIEIPWNQYVTEEKRHLYVPIKELIQK